MAVLVAPSFNDQAISIAEAGVITVSSTYAFTAALAAADYIKYFKLPKYAKLVPFGWAVETFADLDTSTNLTLSLQVTNLTTTKTIVSASTLGQGAAGRVTDQVGNGANQLAWDGFVCDDDNYFVRLLVAAGPSTATSGSIRVTASYTMQSNAGDLYVA